MEVLLVEDNPADVRLVQELLRPRRSPPLQVHPVGRLGAALGLLEQHAFDAVLLDLGLPDSQGLETLARFRAAAPQAPVVVTTHLADEAVAEQALRLGAQDYLVKGRWDADGLHRTLRYAMERMQGELTLRSSEQRYRSLFENALEGIFQSTPVGQFLAVNPAFARLLGYPGPAELMAEIGEIGASIYVPPERRADLLREVATRGQVIGFESCLRRRDGTVIWVRENVRGVPDAHGGLTRLEGAVEDVTSLREAERRLRETAQEYRLLFDGNPHPMWVFDEDTLAFLAVNDTTVERYGWSRDEFLRMTIRDIRPPGELPALLESVERSRRERGRESSGPWKHLRRDGSVLEVEVVSSPLRFGGRPARLVLASDVTERRRLEAQLRQAQKMEAVGRMAGGIAHDFNNMLGVVVGFAGLLMRDLPAGSRAATRVEQIQKAADGAASLTRQLLAFSRQQVLQPRPVDVNAVVADLGQMLRRLIGEDVEIATSLAPDLVPALVDPGQLQQVVVNLVVNARDAMPAGGRILLETSSATLDADYVRLHPDVQPGSYVLLAVTDTGHGMDAATLSRIFDPFFTTKPEGKGTGLGLSTVYGIVRQSGGHVSVYSEPGLGSTFRVFLPPASAAPAGAAESTGAAPLGGGETVLLVEDGDALRVMLAEVLGGSGYRVLACADPREALDLAAAHAGPIHLLLSDVGLPGLPGPELAERLRETRPAVRVLFMSGYTLAQRDRLIGQEHLQKPFSTESLLRTLRRLLDA